MRRVKGSDETFMGKEPIWGEEFSPSLLLDAFNWYNYSFSPKEAKRFLLDHLQSLENKDEIAEKIRKVPDSKVVRNVGWIARCLDRGMKADQKTEEYFNQWCENLAELADAIENKKEEKEEVKETPKVSVQERIIEKALEEAGEIEGFIDEFIQSDCRSKYDMLKYLKSRELSSIVLQKISDIYVEVTKEIEEAILGKDADLVEGYSNFTKAKLKRLKAFYDTIVAACAALAIENKPVRRARRRKEKPLDQIVSKVNYLKEHETLKGLDVRKVVGASEVWVYNVKTKMLGVYRTDNAKGFTFQGTTLRNFDDKTSVAKRLRKPEEVLPTLEKSTKAKLKKLLPSLTTKEINLTGRFNKDTIILKVM